MNPEAIDTLVIETTTTTTTTTRINNNDQSDDFQCEFVEDDPLADPLASTNIEEETNEFDIPCSVIEKVKENTKNDGTKKEEIIRLVDVQELKAKAEANQSQLRLEPKPSCSKDSMESVRPAMPDFEFDDLEDLIQSSRICTSKKQQERSKQRPEPVPSTSYESKEEILEILDENSIKESDDKFREFPDEDSCDKENEIEVSVEEEKEEIKITDDETTNSLFFFEDFEDQITQNVLNKTDLNDSSQQRMNDQIIDDVNETQSTSTVSVIINDEERSEMIELTSTEISDKLFRVNDEAIPSNLTDLNKNIQEPVKPTISNVPDEIPLHLIPVESQTDPKCVKTTPPEMFPKPLLDDAVSKDLCNIPSDSMSIERREVEDSLSVIVEAVDMIQSSQSGGSTTSDVPVRDEEDGGLRSDGSDSGLGSEPSHNGSALSDKSLVHGMSMKLPDAPAKGNLKRRSTEQIDECSTSVTKRSRKGIQFEGVTVYSFPRQQGFSCVPSQVRDNK